MKILSLFLAFFLSFAPCIVDRAAEPPEDAKIMARCMWGECRGMPTKMEQAAVAWCILNRVDDDRWPNTIKGVITQPSQFTGYLSSNPVDEELLDLAIDVLERWEREKNGEEKVGRVLPREYCFFVSSGTGHNNFSTTWPVGREIWDWSLEDPYTEKERTEQDELSAVHFQSEYRPFDGLEDGSNIPRPDYDRVYYSDYPTCH